MSLSPTNDLYTSYCPLDKKIERNPNVLLTNFEQGLLKTRTTFIKSKQIAEERKSLRQFKSERRDFCFKSITPGQESPSENSSTSSKGRSV